MTTLPLQNEGPNSCAVCKPVFHRNVCRFLLGAAKESATPGNNLHLNIEFQWTITAVFTKIYRSTYIHTIHTGYIFITIPFALIYLL